MEMFSYAFMMRALVASLCMAVIAPMLGVFLVIRRQSLLADTLSHVSLAGVALGFFLGVNPTMTTLIIVVLAAVLLEVLRFIYESYSEVSTAILMSGGLALALLLMGLSQNAEVQINQYLFGSIVTISPVQVMVLIGLTLVLILLFLFFKRPMYVLTFDEETAFVDGLPTRLMSLLFNVITGVAITIMIPIAGALLVSAIMVIPAAAAMKIGRTFNQVLVVSIIIGLIGMVGGLMSSYQLNVAPGAMITLLFIGLFIVIFSLQSLFKKMMLRKDG